MLVGIPNVGKSALANSLHQVGRISAAGAYFFVTLATELNFDFALSKSSRKDM